MFFECRLCCILIVFSIDFGKSYIRRNDRFKNDITDDTSNDQGSSENVLKYNKIMLHKKECWMHLNSKHHFEVMDKLDERYAEVRKEYQAAAEKDNFDGQMLEVMLKSRGAAEREIQHVGGHSGLIPAGINLGGYFMMRMPSSLLFFHRMKLRNNTQFRVTFLRNDLVNLTLNARLSLNDLHLVGSFDRSTTDKDPSILFYTPTYGQVEFLLKNVQYKFEGRYRLLKDRFTIELMISEIDFDDVMLTYLNNASNGGIRLQRKNIDDFLIRLKSDLDKWLKDYFNDYLVYFGLVGINSNNKFQQYDKERAKELNNYTDYVIDMVVKRLHEVKAESITLPKFTIFTANSMELLLKGGVLRGLDTMYRRSVATGKREEDLRKVDAVVGFSNLKATYQYEALLGSKNPVIEGMIILSADELTARMELTATKDSESVDIQFEFLEQAKPESLTIEGAANRMIANFKYLLEQHVIAIMTNTLLYNIKMLGSLTRCVPLLHSHRESNNFEDVTNSDKENEQEETTLDDTDAIIESTTPENIEIGQSDNQQAIEFLTPPVSNDVKVETIDESAETNTVNAHKKENSYAPVSNNEKIIALDESIEFGAVDTDITGNSDALVSYNEKEEALDETVKSEAADADTKGNSNAPDSNTEKIETLDENVEPEAVNEDIKRNSDTPVSNNKNIETLDQSSEPESMEFYIKENGDAPVSNKEIIKPLNESTEP